MSESTISEAYFEVLCRNKGIVCERVRESQSEKRPDYRVFIQSTTLITEVKQLDPNSEDVRLSKLWATPKSPGGYDASKRVRDKIAEGYPQVRKLSGGQFPTMIVVYNNAGEWNLLSDFAIGTAMFGEYGFVLESKPDQSIEATRQGYLGKRKLTKETCRFLSAVGVLKGTNPQELELCCYHNPFAEVPIEPRSLAKLATSQYVVPNPHQGGYVPWEPIRMEI